MFAAGGPVAALPHRVRIGLSGVFPPSTEQMDRILRVLEDPALSPVFLHCRRGADGSGMVVACYRVEHDHWTNAQAMKEAHEQGFSGLEVMLKRYVLHFKPDTANTQDAPR